MRSAGLLLGALGLVALSGCASHKTRAPSSLLPPISVPIAQVIHGPPARGSTADLAELKEVLDLQKSRSVQDCMRAEVEAKPSLDAFFGPAVGPLSAAEVARLSPGFGQIFDDIRPVVGKAKDLWSRLRPASQDSRVNPCLPNDSSSSYPSGHAVLATVYARTLGLVFPARAQALIERGEQVGRDRVISGLHYRTDVEDGAVLGAAVFKQLESSAEFQTLVRTMRDGK